MLFSPVYASSDPRFLPGLRADHPRTVFARYAVLPSPSLASGPKVLLFSTLKVPINHAESTLSEVFILKPLKVPVKSTLFEKQGGGWPLWLTNCYERVSVGLLQPRAASVLERGQGLQDFRSFRPVHHRIVFADLAIPEHHHALRKLRDVMLVRHHYNRQAFVIQVLKHFHDLHRRPAIQIAGRRWRS